MASTLLEKVWDLHTVRRLPTGQTQLFIGLHLVHEVTSPQAFDMLRLRGRGVAFPDRTWATIDHIVPTDGQPRPFLDDMAEQMTVALERNCQAFGIPLFDLASAEQGIVHVIGPELGLTQPGMTIACGDSHTATHGAFGAIAFGIPLHGLGSPRRGIIHVIGPELGLTHPGMTIVCGDSHTSTHGAFGALAFGIGTSEVEHVLATQCLLQNKSKSFRVTVDGALSAGVTAKDVILALLANIGVGGGTGHVI